jgi:hypothetical protein
LAAGRSGAERRPKAGVERNGALPPTKKKSFFQQKKESFFLEQRSKACSILFFFQAFRDNMFLLFECFLEKIMPF